MSQLEIIINVGKGSQLTGHAWVDVLLGGEQVVSKSAVQAPFNVDPDKVVTDKLKIVHEYDLESMLTLTVVNNPESIGPIQVYAIEFCLDEKPINLNWQQAIKTKPLRFGGQPNTTIFNPYVGSDEFNGWASVPDISPGMSITWGLADLVEVR